MGRAGFQTRWAPWLRQVAVTLWDPAAPFNPRLSFGETVLEVLQISSHRRVCVGGVLVGRLKP